MPSPRLLQIRASAGSGKTYELTRRYLARLAALRPEQGGAAAARGVLAITFTNAAANEMRERVIGHLKAVALGEESGALGAQTAAKWLDIFLEDSSALNIRTIDSLLHQIIRVSALDLGVNPDYQIVLDTNAALAPYVEVFLEQANTDANIRQMLEKACEAMIGGSKTESFSGGDKILARLGKVMHHALLGEFAELAKEETLAELENSITANVKNSAAELLSLAEKDKWHGTAFKSISKYMAGDFPGDISSYCETDDLKKLFKGKSEIPAKCGEKFEKFCGNARIYHENIGLIRQARLWLACLNMATGIAATFTADMARSGQLPQILASQKAKSVLSPLGAVSEAFCRMGNRLTHFLVDEFQDTSLDQWAVLQALTVESLSRGGSFLWVGDPKQSIYGWRGGKPELFELVAKDAELRAICPECITAALATNWRSGGEIVTHTNKLFGSLADVANAVEVLRAMLPGVKDGKALGKAAQIVAEAYGDVEQKQGKAEAAFISVETIAETKSTEIIDASLERLCQLLREDIGPRRKWSDVLVLVRSNKIAAQAAERLGVAGIPALTENGLRLNENALILQTVAFLEFLANPADDIAFWAVINGDLLCGHAEAAILAKADLATMAATRGKSSLSHAFSQAYPEIWQKFIEPFYAKGSMLTAYDTALEWHRRLDVERRFPLDNTMRRRFLETIYLAENAGMASLAAFLDYWHENSDKEKAPMPQNMDACRIMTIHKAKGLQAPVVILPFTNFNIKASDDPRPYQALGHKVAAVCRAAMKQEYAEEITAQALEAINLLYVALTRPVEELYIFKAENIRKGEKNTLPGLKKLLELAGMEGSYTEGEKPEPKQKAANMPMADVDTSGQAGPENFEAGWPPMAWLPRLKIFRNHARPEGLAPNERGTLLHAALENLPAGNASPTAAEAALLAAERATGIVAPKDARPDILKALHWFISIPEAEKWLEGGMPEHTLLTGEGKACRADLIAPYSRAPLVIDYKSGAPAPAHIGQIRNYLRLLKASGQFQGEPEGLLVYLDQQLFMKVEIGKEYPLTEKLPDMPGRL